MRAPETVVAGKATARLTFEAWPEGKVQATTAEFEVRAAKPGPKLEAISTRFLRELIHPNRKNFLHSLQFSPDGQRLIGSDFPGGVIQVWDVATGRQMPKSETGMGTGGRLEAYCLSADGKTAFVAHNKSKYEMLEQDGKKMMRWTFTGQIKAWDVATGQVRATYQHDPPRSTISLRLSPDGRKLLALEEPPGVFERRPERVVTLWDAQTHQAQPLPPSAGWGIFSHDSRFIAYVELDKDRYSRGVKLREVATGQEKLLVPMDQPALDASLLGFTPDGKMLLASVRDYGSQRQSTRWDTTFKLWDVATGRELLTFPGTPRSGFNGPAFTADGRLGSVFAYSFGDTNGSNLLLLDLEKKQLRKTLLLGGPPAPGQRVRIFTPAFSPDGKWLAVVTWLGPDKPTRDPEPEDFPQPRIHLIDTATGEVRETLIAPHGFPYQLCFSPDGKTLAVGDRGKVLLWDMTQPPGTVGAAGNKEKPAISPASPVAPVSPRPQRELVHPHHLNLVHHFGFSSDGKQVYALDTPDGLLLTWEAATGKQVARGNTRFGSPDGHVRFTLSPDGTIVYVRREVRKTEQIDKGGKRSTHRRFESTLQAWDRATGRMLKEFRHEPARNTLDLQVSPDGRKLLAYEELPGPALGKPPRAATLWDVATGQGVPWTASGSRGLFSPDGQTLAYEDHRTQPMAPVVRLFATTSGQEKLSIPPQNRVARVSLLGFTPDGKKLLGYVQMVDQAGVLAADATVIKSWDAHTGQELASLPTQSHALLIHPAFAPDGRTCALNVHGDPRGNLLLVDLVQYQIRKSVILDTKVGTDQRVSVLSSTFSPEGKRLAVLTRLIPAKTIRDLAAESFSRPRIHLIDTSTGEVRETLSIAPGLATQLCFSPDGKTLAVGDRGKVLLLDMSKPPGSGLPASARP